MELELWKLELRKDWAVIAGSVECPECGAEVGETCHYKDRPDLPRMDFHQRRKIMAAQAFLADTEGEHAEPATQAPRRKKRHAAGGA